MSMKIRTYSEMIKLPTYKERYEYLKIGGVVGKETFGLDRFVNQQFYKSRIWQRVRDEVILRDTIGDYCCDLGIPGHEIHGRIIIHHMNPILLEDILDLTDILLNPDMLISTIHNTHNAIHYGDESLLIDEPVVRRPNDTCPWRR